MPRIRAYHFDLGDSSEGQVGCCFVVCAYSRKRALEFARYWMAGEFFTFDKFRDADDLGADEAALGFVPGDDEGILYCAAYGNPNAITLKDARHASEEYL